MVAKSAKPSFEKTMSKRLSEINEQLDFVYSSMQEALQAQNSDPENKLQAMKDYDVYLGEYKDLLSCQIMIAKNYNDIVGVGKTADRNAPRRQKSTLEKMREKRG